MQLRCVVLAALAACSSLLPQLAHGETLAAGTAITDPLALRELDLREHRTEGVEQGGFGLRRMLQPEQSTAAPLFNAELFALPSMATVRQAIDRDIDGYVARHRADFPGETVGVGDGYDLQVFDRDRLYSARTRFVLAGIVNRMDRAFVSPASCGEIRLIYRLTQIDATAGAVRLPMTLNVVLRAKDDSTATTHQSTTCADIARRWLAMRDEPLSGAPLALKLTASGSPLQWLRPAQIMRIEINLQVGHVAKSAAHEFRTDYLMKVFHYDAAAHSFTEARLENQIDRDRIVADADLAAEFRQWLLQPAQLGELDRGTLLIPEKYLATFAIAPTPVGFVRSKLQPEFGLVQSAGVAENGALSEHDVVAALAKAATSGIVLHNIRSLAGFERRLNDITCAGCHQTRGIGGFHFPGVDWMVASPSNATTVPASPHFFGDQVRRRNILAAIRDGIAADYSRGFSSRPQLRGDKTLLGTEYYDGWGAHCYDLRAKPAANDRSFQSWTCAKGLVCQVIGSAGRSERMGMCFVGSHSGEARR
jgi:hypothetical protein